MTAKPDHSDRENLPYGICVLSLTNEVIYQNSTCRKVCGSHEGSLCDTRKFSVCRNYRAIKDLIEGIHCGKPELMPDKKEVFDICAVRTDNTVEVHFYPAKAKYSKVLEQVAGYDLTPKQREIVSLRVFGYDAAAICRHLKISNNTLKTHIKNIYARVPASIRKFI